MENEEKNGLPPEKLGVLLEKIITHPSPKVRYTIGKLEQRLSTIYKRWAPSSMYERSFMKYYKLWETQRIKYGGLVELIVNAMEDVKPGYIQWERH